MSTMFIVMNIKLSPEEKQELEVRHNQEKNHRKADRIKSVLLRRKFITKNGRIVHKQLATGNFDAISWPRLLVNNFLMFYFYNAIV